MSHLKNGLMKEKKGGTVYIFFFSVHVFIANNFLRNYFLYLIQKQPLADKYS